MLLEKIILYITLVWCVTIRICGKFKEDKKIEVKSSELLGVFVILIIKPEQKA